MHSFNIQVIATLLITYRVAYGAAWVNGTSQTILGTKGGTNLKEMHTSGVRVQVDFSGPHERSTPSNHVKSDVQHQLEAAEYEINTGKEIV